jgi:hypothetical protein
LPRQEMRPSDVSLRSSKSSYTGSHRNRLRSLYEARGNHHFHLVCCVCT